MLDSIRQDVAYAVRRLAQSIFNVVNAVLLRSSSLARDLRVALRAD